jgi:hypothetical protein
MAIIEKKSGNHLTSTSCNALATVEMSYGHKEKAKIYLQKACNLQYKMACSNLEVLDNKANGKTSPSNTVKSPTD